MPFVVAVGKPMVCSKPRLVLRTSSLRQRYGGADLRKIRAGPAESGLSKPAGRLKAVHSAVHTGTFKVRLKPHFTSQLTCLNECPLSFRYLISLSSQRKKSPKRFFNRKELKTRIFNDDLPFFPLTLFLNPFRIATSALLPGAGSSPWDRIHFFRTLPAPN